MLPNNAPAYICNNFLYIFILSPKCHPRRQKGILYFLQHSKKNSIKHVEKEKKSGLMEYNNINYIVAIPLTLARGDFSFAWHHFNRPRNIFFFLHFSFYFFIICLLVCPIAYFSGSGYTICNIKYVPLIKVKKW